MALFRLLLALLIGVAVATAPVAAAMASVKSAAKTAMADDCHGKGAKPCPDCDSKAKKAKCPGDGSKCCKLTGTIAALPTVPAVTISAHELPQPQSIPDRSLRPQIPPPRS
jgi:hypothetical protein